MRCAIYTRVSTGDQDTSLQKEELTIYAISRGWEVKFIFEDKLTGTNTNRPGYQQLREQARLRSFDILLVWKLDRMFRSLKDCLNGLQEITDLKIDFISLKDPGIDMTTPSGQLMVHLLGAFAQFEASLIRSRVKAGVKSRIAKTGRWGPPRKRNDSLILTLRQKGLSIRRIATITGLSATSVARSLKAVPGTRPKPSA